MLSLSLMPISGSAIKKAPLVTYEETRGAISNIEILLFCFLLFFQFHLAENYEDNRRDDENM